MVFGTAKGVLLVVVLHIQYLYCTNLVLFFEINPQLKTDVISISVRHLCMHDPSSGRHPLQVPGVNGSPVAAKVFVFEGALQHVGHLSG